MQTIFLTEGYVLLVLIESKNQIFHENFATISELHQFEHFLQQEFNKRDLNVVITSNTLSIEDFNVIGDIVMKSNTCSYNLYYLPMNILTMLLDTKLITDFLIDLENEKIEKLKGMQNTNQKVKENKH